MLGGGGGAMDGFLPWPAPLLKKSVFLSLNHYSLITDWRAKQSQYHMVFLNQVELFVDAFLREMMMMGDESTL